MRSQGQVKNHTAAALIASTATPDRAYSRALPRLLCALMALIVVVFACMNDPASTLSLTTSDAGSLSLIDSSLKQLGGELRQIRRQERQKREWQAWCALQEARLQFGKKWDIRRILDSCWNPSKTSNPDFRSHKNAKLHFFKNHTALYDPHDF